MNDLIVAKLGRARELLAQCTTPGMTKKVIDLAVAAEVYARRAKLGEEAIQYAHEVKIDAETLLGEMLAVAEKNKGAKGSKVTGNKREPVKDTTPTLASIGLSKKESSQAQALAKLKREEGRRAEP